MELEFSQQIFETCSYTKFRENPVSFRTVMKPPHLDPKQRRTITVTIPDTRGSISRCDAMSYIKPVDKTPLLRMREAPAWRNVSSDVMQGY